MTDDREWVEWDTTGLRGKPILSPRGKAILEAVEALVREIEKPGAPDQGDRIRDLRRAYLGTAEAEPAKLSPEREARLEYLAKKYVAGQVARGELKPVCPTCGGSKRVPCPENDRCSLALLDLFAYALGKDDLVTDGPCSCEDGKHDDDLCLCTIPCPTCGAKEVAQ